MLFIMTVLGIALALLGAVLLIKRRQSAGIVVLLVGLVLLVPLVAGYAAYAWLALAAR